MLSLTGQADKIARASGELGLIQAGAAGPWMPKLLLVLLDLFAAFFAFSMSVRLFNHVGYLINVPLSSGHPEITPAHVARQLNRAGRFYSIGMRAFYFLVPLVFWVFGPLSWCCRPSASWRCSASSTAPRGKPAARPLEEDRAALADGPPFLGPEHLQEHHRGVVMERFQVRAPGEAREEELQVLDEGTVGVG